MKPEQPMKREIGRVTEVAVPVADLAGLDGEANVWLGRLPAAEGLGTLLAVCDDGVIWGYRADQVFITSGDVTGSTGPPHPPLQASTLHWARVFGEAGELLVWRTDDGWQGRLIRPVAAGEQAGWTGRFDEDQVLWGTRAERLEHTEFSRLTDGSEGLAHLVPLKQEFDGEGRRLRLTVRHYLAADAYGAERIVASRLVGVKAVEKGQGNG